MKVRIMEDEYCRPRLYWFLDEETGKESEPFFMGDIKEKVELLESLGIMVVNKED